MNTQEKDKKWYYNLRKILQTYKPKVVTSFQNTTLLPNETAKIQYFTKLFKEENRSLHYIHVNTSEIPQITPEYVEAIINNMKWGKAAGPDNITAEILQQEETRQMISTQLANSFQTFLNKGFIPNYFTESRIIMLNKT